MWALRDATPEAAPAADVPRGAARLLDAPHYTCRYCLCLVSHAEGYIHRGLVGIFVKGEHRGKTVCSGSYIQNVLKLVSGA